MMMSCSDHVDHVVVGDLAEKDDDDKDDDAMATMKCVKVKRGRIGSLLLVESCQKLVSTGI